MREKSTQVRAGAVSFVQKPMVEVCLGRPGTFRGRQIISSEVDGPISRNRHRRNRRCNSPGRQEARNFFGAANQLSDTAAGPEPRREQPVPIWAQSQILNVCGRLTQVEKWSRRTQVRTGKRTIVRTRRWLPSSPLYSSVASDHGQDCSDGRQQRCSAL